MSGLTYERGGGPLTNNPRNAKDEPPKDEPGLLDEVADRLGFRDRIRAHPALGPLYRIGVALLGVAVIALGIALLPLPGPGWLIIFLGLGILASEFAWAERLLDFAKAKVRGWTRWIMQQSLLMRGLVSLGCLVIVAGVVAGFVIWQGVPSWLLFDN